jgi:Holliday junction resolvase RusA-like endonuclease
VNIKSLEMLEKCSLSEHAKEQIRSEFSKKKAGNRVANSAPNVERAVVNELLFPYAGTTFNTPVRVDIYSTRQRKTDIDNISGKAVLDGCVAAGIFKDDSPDFIECYQVHKPEISAEEKTVIVIEEV